MPPVVNISAYQFTTLSDLKPLRERLLTQCKAWGLRGTILLSTEGINLFVAGARESIELLLGEVRALPGLADFTPKFSESDDQPFTRMLVRIKKEIIAFGVPDIQPANYTSAKLPAMELKRWLDEGRPVTLLDTRNDYEVKLGTFKNAVTLDLDTFRNFPAAVSRLPEELKQQPVVMFCTGGIRCEKAGPYMEREGFQNILQLDGGILKYFEECGGEHYDGECFVFDQRVGVDPSLAESENIQCFACLAPLTPEEQNDPRYELGKSCRYCYQPPEKQIAETVAMRQQQLAAVAASLPGSQPYHNYRPLSIPAQFDQATLLDALSGIFKHVEPEEWSERLANQGFVDGKMQPVAADRVVRSGERYYHCVPAAAEPEVSTEIQVLYEDEALVVINKPAPLPLHPSGRFNRNTLQYILNLVYDPYKLRPTHRLDANTTGVIVLAKTKRFASRVQTQFARGEVDKVYRVRVQGHPAEDQFACDAPISSETSDLGARVIDQVEGLPSRTEFTVLQRNDDGTTLLEARPISGRTNQIRVHLWHLGFPVLGDQTYLAGGVLGQTQTLELGEQPLCLHSYSIAFEHPSRDERVVFTAPAPAWSSI